jgi:protein-disulfide isomerase
MGNPLRISRFLLILLVAAGVGCKAQSVPVTNATDAKLDRQIKLTIRSQYNVPPDYSVILGARTKSDINGFDSLSVTFSNSHAQKKTMVFLISNDNNTLARLEKFDLTRNPSSGISTLGRPIRGNPKAKVTVISFDDLECPFCSRMNEVLFPATQQHYGDLVRYVYKDFPLPMHPWAMHAAVDVNCLAAQSEIGYWNLIDTFHEHGTEIAGQGGQQQGGQQNVAAATQKLDDMARAEGKRQSVNIDKLNSCMAKQDDSGIRSSMKQGDALAVDGTPTLFINGERATGALSQDMLWTVIDRAIRDAGEVPPPPPQNDTVKPPTPPVR